MPDSDQQVSGPAGRQALSGFAASALDYLYQHRLLTTGQIGRLLLPEARSNYATREAAYAHVRSGFVANVRDQAAPRRRPGSSPRPARRWWRAAGRSPPGPTG